ncbi:uncharacterized protein IUM83_09283 [Phytophthora cinnamomi]|uniref:uncharacterized protein n=1 Tax=Phytophthora cinnamomi TaxID=4785 RepID=UPI003559F399|nr:hypothetical protein IUM83_09283 [Phytophthora cinnamomi]
MFCLVGFPHTPSVLTWVFAMPSSLDSESSDSTVDVDPEDVGSGSCRVCALGTRHPPVPQALPVQLPSIEDPDKSVASLLIDATGLEHGVARLREYCELATAYNAGLAAHASTLHDRNRALWQRAREGFALGAATVNELHERLESLQRENGRLEDVAVHLRDRADHADSFETRYRVLEQSSLEYEYRLQAELQATQTRVAELEARLALVTPPPTVPSVSSTPLPDAQAPPDRGMATVQADLASTRAALPAVNAQLETVMAERDQALSESVEHGRQHDAVVEELRDARDQLVRSQRETESARQLNTPLEADVRRGLLVAHAEERQRDLARIRDLKASLSSSEAARIAAQADLTRAQAEELRASSRADRFRDGLREARDQAARQQTTGAARVHRLSTRVVGLEEELARTPRNRDERAAVWRCLLREAPLGREQARRVCPAGWRP